MKERLESLDILRGADMFLLLFLGPVLRAVAKVFGLVSLNGQLSHVEWEGFATWDIIMPLFLFLSGITVPFSLAKYKGKVTPDRSFYLKLLKRFCMLFFLGWMVQGNVLFLDWKIFHPYANTLQSIAIGYVVASLLFVFLKPGWQIAAGIALFAVYWIAFACTGMNLDPQENIAMVIDKAVLGSHRAGVDWNADGLWSFRPGYQYTWILSSLNFVVTVLMGCFAGQILRTQKYQKSRRALVLAVIGVLLVGAGLLINPVFPIIKKIWSSSFTLYSGGLCFLLTALTYYIVDVRGWGKLLSWLKIYGMNAILAYCVGMVVNFTSVSASVLVGFEGMACYPILLTFLNSTILFVILSIMYKHKIFLKV